MAPMTFGIPGKKKQSGLTLIKQTAYHFIDTVSLPAKTSATYNVSPFITCLDCSSDIDIKAILNCMLTFGKTFEK